MAEVAGSLGCVWTFGFIAVRAMEGASLCHRRFRVDGGENLDPTKVRAAAVSFFFCAGAWQDIQTRSKWKVYNQEARAGHTSEIAMKIP